MVTDWRVWRAGHSATRCCCPLSLPLALALVPPTLRSGIQGTGRTPPMLMPRCSARACAPPIEIRPKCPYKQGIEYHER